MAVVILLMAGCDELTSHFVTPDNLDMIGSKMAEKRDAMKVHKLTFSPDYKTFNITTRMYGDIGPYSLTDTSKVRTEVHCTTSGILSTSIPSHASSTCVTSSKTTLSRMTLRH